METSWWQFFVKLKINRSIGWNLEFTKMELTQRIYNGPDCYSWRKVFALLPVKTINGNYVWMRSIYKRRYWAVWGTGFHMEPHVEYATMFDILGNNT